MHRKKILVVDDEKLIRWGINQHLSEWDLEANVAETGREALSRMEREAPDLVILDVNLPDTRGTDLLQDIKRRWPDVPVIIITAFGSIDDAVVAMRSGAYDFITKPIDYLKLKGAIDRAFETLSLKKEIAYYKEKERRHFEMSSVVAESEVMRRILEMARIVAESEAGIVLLSGESGTGKDLLAQVIHHSSRRRNGPFLVINCAAIPENLLESELFGYEKGAFTDAHRQKKGLVEMSHEGTLFLDEIGTLSAPLQAKLLRFLETRAFKRIGGLRDIEVNLRVIAATNRDLKSAFRRGEFREDLFYRLNVCPIVIPPLRDRPGDIVPLAESFIQEFNLKFQKNILGLSPQVREAFQGYGWPGNVRELRNAIERAMIFEQGKHISMQHIPPLPGSTAGSPPAGEAMEVPRDITLEAMERFLLIRALRRSRGNKSRAARLLGVTRDTVRYKLQKLDIDPETGVGDIT